MNDFFFEFDKRKPLACEGMFSKNGDYFAITSYSGALSIFSIYSKNSYSATYMNQFYSIEFERNLDQISNNFTKTGIPSLTIMFPRQVNMYNLPYIIEQPYSSFKLEQIKNNKKILNNKYCLTDREIRRLLANNLSDYEKYFEERVQACQKEEEAYYNAEKDNMNYRINRNNNDDIDQMPEDNYSQDESFENDSYNNNNNNNNSRNNNRANRFFDENDMEIEEEYDDLELSREDLRVTSSLRNQNNSFNMNNNSNNNSNNIWSQRLRRPITNTLRRSNNVHERASTRYNLRNNVRNNSSHSNSRNRNIISNNR